MAKPPSSSPSFANTFDRHVPCPGCGSQDTRVSSPFGGTVSEILFQCEACGDGFGWMKWEHRMSKDLDAPTPVSPVGEREKES